MNYSKLLTIAALNMLICFAARAQLITLDAAKMSDKDRGTIADIMKKRNGFGDMRPSEGYGVPLQFPNPVKPPTMGDYPALVFDSPSLARRNAQLEKYVSELQKKIEILEKRVAELQK